MHSISNSQKWMHNIYHHHGEQIVFLFLFPALPITDKKDPSSLDAAVPIVPDSCGVYGTFYVDLTGNGLKTFNSPARCPKRPHCRHTSSSQDGAATVRISQPATVVKTTLVQAGQALPWKQALPSQPKMGVLKESWENNYKQGDCQCGVFLAFFFMSLLLVNVDL